ncbi:MAG: imidazole glycerol phosphate synthase subunit HisH, partial [Clostridia bacterium]|nr:imidazole glycerol phosphate synthase subunit HisH [Clostridia bacterium]
MIAVVDYGVGNLFSIKSSFARVGAEVVITSDKNVIRNAEKIMLPGVGAYEVAANRLRETGLADLLREEAAKPRVIVPV